MKKILLIIGLFLIEIITLRLMSIKKLDSQTSYLMDYGDYKNITKDNIKQLEIIRYTEGGDNHKVISEEETTIIYNNLKQKKLGNKTTMACEDNTVVYVFTLTDDTTLSIEIECDWVIINNERYILE